MIALAAASCTAVSCTDTALDRDEDNLTEIRLTSGIDVLSKAAWPQTDIQITKGERVRVWVDRNTEGYPELYGQILTADGSGNLSGDYKMYFPMNGDNVNIYALHTNAYFPDSDFPAATFTHYVSTEQTGLEQYVSSDLLYARSRDVAKTEDAVPLKFYHQLSKLQVAIVAKDGIMQEDIAEVTVGGTRVLANVTLTKDMSANALTVTPAGSPAAISIGTDLSTDFFEGSVRYNDVIIVPQTVPSGTAFLNITLRGGTSITYKLDSDAVFESGRKYILQMTVDLKSIELNTVVSDWLDGDPIIGNSGTVRYIVHYTDNTSERTYTDGPGPVTFNGSGKTVRSIELPDYGRTYLIGRKDITSIELNLDEDGDLNFRPSEDGYTPIGSYAEMQLINTLGGAMAGYYRQEADLDLMNEQWTPIGSEQEPFTGIFDGNGFEILRINVAEGSATYAGLFGYLRGNQAVLKDIILASGVVEGTAYTGGICAYCYGGTLDGCRNAAMIQCATSTSNVRTYSGGIAAYLNQGRVLNCGNSGNVSASSTYEYSYSGGITGYMNNSGEITACCNSGRIISASSYENSYSGGIAGYINNSGEIAACYNSGSISSSYNNMNAFYQYSISGGIAGYIENSGEITACYNTGRIVANVDGRYDYDYEYEYGIAYGISSSIVTSCYWLDGMSEDGGVPSDVKQKDVLSFTGSFTPDAAAYPEWGLGNGETNGWWKNYNGNNNLPQQWWE